MTTIKWTCTATDLRTMLEIVDRADPKDRLTMMMDLEAVHANGCPLDFERLLAADDSNFWHDISGIQANIDRETGTLRSTHHLAFAHSE